MNAYLELAEAILKRVRRPLSAKSMLRHAYLFNVVPTHLYGKTQHKTLQARLSEDILYNRDSTKFVRTKPGRFFLTELIRDPSIPAKFKSTMIARRRTRDLVRGAALSVSVKEADRALGDKYWAPVDQLLSVLKSFSKHRYFDYKKIPGDYAPVWAAATVSKNNKVLAYRTSKHDSRTDGLPGQRTVLFTSLVTEDDYTLFDLGEYGIGRSAMTAVCVDLDVPVYDGIQDIGIRNDTSFFFSIHNGKQRKFVTYVNIKVPEWFEPNVNRLSMSDLRWIDTDVVPNDIHDFDGWSIIVLERLRCYQGQYG